MHPSPQPRRSLVIDTDTASDDAVALVMALKHPDVEVRALTIVAGNVPLHIGERNAKVTLELLGRDDIPVHRGIAVPLLRPLETAQHVHGDDGMSGVPFPDPAFATDPQHAVLALLDIAQREPGRHDLVTLGPLTNIATALAIDPDLLTRFRHTWMMVGAADGRGNVSPAGEFNAWADPEAAKIVLEARGPKTMIGWDVSRKYALIRPDEDAALRALGRLGAFASTINADVDVFASSISGSAGYDLPDPVAMAVALDETLITESVDLHLSVATDAATRGQTFADQRHPLKPANTRVVLAVDEQRFKEQLFTLLRDDEEGAA